MDKYKGDGKEESEEEADHSLRGDVLTCGDVVRKAGPAGEDAAEASKYICTPPHIIPRIDRSTTTK
jgi:hypothetical protein